jgi:hypothetical protein
LSGVFFLLRDNISFFELSRSAKEMGEHARDLPDPNGKAEDE